MIPQKPIPLAPGASLPPGLKPQDVQVFTPLSAAEVDEHILKPCYTFPEFRAFYEANAAELDTVMARCSWVHMPVVDHALGAFGHSDNLNPIIQLPALPVKTLRQAETVAHELIHGLLWLRGYPAFRPRSQNKTLIRLMQTFINYSQHLIVLPTLQRYGFQPLDNNRQRWALMVNLMGDDKSPVLPTVRLELLVWAVEWSLLHELEYTALTGNKPNADFYARRRRCGQVDGMAGKISKEVQRIGWDTKEQHEKLLAWFIDNYKLDVDMIKGQP